MLASPFATPAVSAPASRQAEHQSYAFAVMGAAVFVLALLLHHLIAALSRPELLTDLLDYLPGLLPGWLFALLLNGLACLLLTRWYMARHAIVYTHPGRLLLGIGAAMLLADLLYGALSGFLLSGVYAWLSEHSSMLAIYHPLVFEPLGLIAFAITVLLPLWGGLRLGKHHAAADPSPPPRPEVPLLLALGFILLSLKLMALIPGHLLNSHEWHVELVLLYLSPLLCGAVIALAAWYELPERQNPLRPGQLMLASLLIFVGWLVSQLLVAGILLVSAFGGSDALLQPLPLIVAGTAVLALLWPLTLLGLRWVYRAEAAA
jgi:hypothetical protein